MMAICRLLTDRPSSRDRPAVRKMKFSKSSCREEALQPSPALRQVQRRRVGRDRQRGVRQRDLQDDHERHQEQRQQPGIGDGDEDEAAHHSASSTPAVAVQDSQTWSSQVKLRREMRRVLAVCALMMLPARQLDVIGREIAQIGDVDAPCPCTALSASSGLLGGDRDLFGADRQVAGLPVREGPRRGGGERRLALGPVDTIAFGADGGGARPR